MRYDARDTPQQRAILRQSKPARSTRRLYPAGTSIVSVADKAGVVKRHVPGMNAQGGHLVVLWDENGHTGRISPSQVRRA